MFLKRTLAAGALALGLAACGGGDNATETDISGAQVPLPTIGSSGGVLSNAVAKQIFGAQAGPSRQIPAAYGSYSKGCLAGGAQLPETGPTWQAMRLSRNRNWAHPDTIDMIEKLSRRAAQQPGWAGIYVGDMSQARGGPMLTGHASHQMGLDADVWLLPPESMTLSRAQRESISSVSLRRANGAYTNDRWTRAHHEVVKAAAEDPRVARIFIFPGAKVQMCDDETGDRSYLRKIRPWYGHHYHFHVRLACPRGASGCVDQAPPPPGDGCDDARQWQANILNPPKAKPRDPDAPDPAPKRELLLADLPAQCQAVLDN